MIGNNWHEQIDVFTRTSETDTWTAVSGCQRLSASFYQVGGGGARRENTLMDLEATHVIRTLKTANITQGMRIRRRSDDTEYEVRTVFEREHPRPGLTMIEAIKVKEVLT